MDERHNERVKLAATYANNLATAFAVSGFIAPLAQQQLEQIGPFLLSLILLCLSGACYWMGYLILGGIRS